MTRFENALLEELTTLVRVDVAPRRRAPRRRAPRRPRTVAGLAAVTAAVAVVTGALVLSPRQQSPGFALDRRSDGGFRLRIDDIRAVGPANDALAAAGVRARVVRLGGPGSCPEYTIGDRQVPLPPGFLGPAGENVVSFPATVPPGHTYLLLVSDDRPGLVSILGNLVRGPTPSCAQWTDVPPGLPPAVP
jgi:hypothetical protein